MKLSKVEILKIPVNNRILIFYTNHTQQSWWKIKIIEQKVLPITLLIKIHLLNRMETYSISKCIPHILSLQKILKIIKGIQMLSNRIKENLLAVIVIELVKLIHWKALISKKLILPHLIKKFRLTKVIINSNFS
jgi:hypothetical protein